MTTPSNEIGVVLIAHGSRRPEANAELHELVARIDCAGVAAQLEPAFLELAEPTIESAAGRCVDRGAGLVVLVPFFLSMGIHQTRDLAQIRAQLASHYPSVQFRLGPPLGPHPLLDELVRIRIEESVRGGLASGDFD